MNPPRSDAVTQAPQPFVDLARRWVERFNASDAPGVAALHTGDTIYIDAGVVYHAREGVEAHLREAWEFGYTSIDIEVLEAEAHGSIAYGITRYVATNPDAPPLRGHGLLVFLQQAGEWRIHRIAVSQEVDAEEEPEPQAS
jgi:ketosteroid isomerase-like protein